MSRGLYSAWGRAPRAYGFVTSLYLLDPVLGRRRGAVDALDLGPGDRVLDLCCGTGMNLPLLLDRVGPKGSVVGLDRSREMIGAASARVEDRQNANASFRVADAAATGLEDEDFDAVLCVLGLSVVPDPRGVVREAHRLLKPGGRFVVLDGGSYRGALRVVNPVVRPLLRYAAGADADRDLPAVLRAEFSEVDVRRSQSGSIVLAIAYRE